MFEEYDRNLHDLACEDTLDRFRRSPVLRGIQDPLVTEAQELYDALVDSLEARTLDNAKGANLDVIGRIVGLWPRPSEDAAALIYFGPDYDEGAPDRGIAYVTNAPTAGQVEVGDPKYREAIRVQILKNHVKHGSAPEIMNYGIRAFGIPISVRNVGSSDVEVVIAAAASPDVVAAILSVYDDERADRIYALPLPSTARIRSVFFRTPDAFAPDLDSGAPDVASVGIGYVVNA